mmetsp:Transcript_38923/g.87354  ORF Transcript_38923/g.87354 Transcript_38923/m.87354 type:complete len:220 (+) Transcript_38923:770-1429(+)
MAKRLLHAGAVGGLELQHGTDQFLGCGMNLGAVGETRARQDNVWGNAEPFELERYLPEQHLVQQDSQSPAIYLLIMPLTGPHLRRQVLESPHQGLPPLSGAEHSRIAEVAKLHPVVSVNEHVFRLEVPVDNLGLLAVEVVQCLQGLVEIPRRLLMTKPPLLPQQLEHSQAPSKLQSQINVFRGLKMELQLHDMPVVHRIHNADLTLQLVKPMLLDQSSL